MTLRTQSPVPVEMISEFLARQGYRYCGPSAGKHGALLYQKRRSDLEADADSNAKCCINVWEWPPRADWQSVLNGSHYEVNVYWETDEPNSYAAQLMLYTFTEDQLREQLAALESVCVSLWNTYSKGRKQQIDPSNALLT